eukprot:gene13230-15277_t
MYALENISQASNKRRRLPYKAPPMKDRTPGVVYDEPEVFITPNQQYMTADEMLRGRTFSSSSIAGQFEQLQLSKSNTPRTSSSASITLCNPMGNRMPATSGLQHATVTLQALTPNAQKPGSPSKLHRRRVIHSSAALTPNDQKPGSPSKLHRRRVIHSSASPHFSEQTTRSPHFSEQTTRSPHFSEQMTLSPHFSEQTTPSPHHRRHDAEKGSFARRSAAKGSFARRRYCFVED